MANVVYPLILLIFILGAGITYINDAQLYPLHLPDSGVKSQVAGAESTALALQQTRTSPLSGLEQLFILMGAAWGGLTAIFTLGPLLINLGVPVGLVGWFISPLAIVVIFWLIEMWLGRPAE